MDFIPYGRQEIDQNDIDAIIEALKSDWLTQGPLVDQFEYAIASYVQSAAAVAVCNATAALHIACCALDLEPGDIVWTTPNTFVASANCARYCGADVDFVDIDARTYNMSVLALSEKLAKARKAGLLPKIVIPVHFSGQSCDMEAIKKLSDEYDFRIIEDASHAIGGMYQNKPIGNCLYSDMTIFSFHPVKIMTTGEGGVATTNNPELAKKLQLFRSHSVTRDEQLMTKATEGAWYYQQIGLGFNYRITDLQCALGVSQLNRVDRFVEKRNQLASRYNTLLKGFPLILPSVKKDCYSAFHLYVIQIDPVKTFVNRKQLFDYLRSKNIGVNVHYIPVHLQPYYQNLGFNEGDFIEAENYYQHAISIPLYYSLTEQQQDYIVDSIRHGLS